MEISCYSEKKKKKKIKLKNFQLDPLTCSPNYYSSLIVKRKKKGGGEIKCIEVTHNAVSRQTKTN